MAGQETSLSSLTEAETLQYGIHVVAMSNLYAIAMHGTLAIQSGLILNPFHIHDHPCTAI